MLSVADISLLGYKDAEKILSLRYKRKEKKKELGEKNENSSLKNDIVREKSVN